MKFTELLERWMDARDNYYAAKRSSQYDYPYLDDQYSIMIKYRVQIDNIVEELQGRREITETNSDA